MPRPLTLAKRAPAPGELIGKFIGCNPKSPCTRWFTRTSNGEGGIRTQGRFASCSETRSSGAKREKTIQEVDGLLPDQRDSYA